MKTCIRKLALSAPIRVSVCLFLVCLSASTSAPAQQLAANNKPGPRKSSTASTTRSAAPRRVVLTLFASLGGGARVRITSDAPLDDYAAYRQGGRFFVRIPSASAASNGWLAAGANYTDARVEQEGEDLLVSFGLVPGATARVEQKFNRLEVVFAAQQQQDQQSGSSTSGGATNNNAKPAEAKPTPSPEPSPTTNTTPPVSANDGAPTETKAAGATEAIKGTAEAATTSAARLNALLTPEKKNPVKINKLDKPPVIDGKLDEEVWKQAAVFKDFVQYRPTDLVAPTKPTEAYIGYDAKFLYVAFKAFDEPGKVRSTVAKRDNVFDDDWVGVWLDTFDDGRRAYELIFNPLGVQADAVFTEGVNEDFSVDIVMESKGSITADGFVVEVAIPFKSLRYQAGKDKLWGLHLLRTIKRFNNEQSSWMPISRDNSSLLGQRGHITGLEGISAERTLEIIPSLTISETGRRVNSPVPGAPPINTNNLTAPGRILNKPVEFDPGVTTKFTVTPQVTLDFTYNPDFAQVEADATVVTANQRFPIFFEEKRPFFLEGKEIFETLISAVHTRAIVDPDYAAKLTGKQGRNTFGLMVASDKAPGNLSDDDRNFIGETADLQFEPDPLRRTQLEARRDSLLKVLDKNATIGVVRFKRDVGKENHVGLLATTYNFIDKYNHVAGVDTRWRLNKTTTFTAQVMGSVSNQSFFYPDEGLRADRRENGMVYGAYLNMNGRNWGYELGAVGRSRFFRADVGFNRRFDTNNPTLFVRYNSTEKPKAAIVSWRVYNFFGSNFDWRGRHQRYNNESQLQLRFQRQTFLGVGVEKGFERVFDDEFGATREANRRLVEQFRGASAALPACDNFGTLAPLRLDDLSTPGVNERVDYPQCTFFGPDNERSASRKSVYTYFETTPAKKFAFSMFTSYNIGVIDLDGGSGSPRYPRISPAAIEFGQDAPQDPGAGDEWFWESTVRFVPTDALNLSLNYVKDRLTRHDTGRVAFDDNIFSLRGTYQFTRFWFARGRVDYTTLSSRMRMQYLLGWTPNPGTQFYVGYNDDLNRHGFNPFNGDLEPGFRRNGRTFFIKMSYLIRKSFGND